MTNDSSVQVDRTELRPLRVGQALRSSLVLIVVLGVIGLLLGVLAGQLRTPSISATTSVLLNPLEGNPFYPSSRGEQLVNLSSEAQALRSNRVAEAVIPAVDSERSPSELLSDVSVTAPTNTQILRVTYSAANEHEARRYSQAFADAYLDLRRERAQDLIDGRTEELDAQIETRQTALQEMAKELTAETTSPARATVLEQQMAALTTEVSALSTTRAELGATPTDPGDVVRPAASDRSGPLDALLLPVGGAVAGCLAGLAISIVRMRLDSRVRHADDLRDMGIPVLANIGIDASEDDFRGLRAVILAREPGLPLALLVGDAADHAVGTRIVPGLAVSFASSGLDTVVIDATVIEPGPATEMKANKPEGLSTVLRGRSHLKQAMVRTDDRLRVLPPGDALADSADELTGEAMYSVLGSVEEESDVVIVAAGSLHHGSVRSLASMVGAVVIGATLGVTTRPEIEQVVQALEPLTCRLIGAVLVDDASRR